MPVGRETNWQPMACQRLAATFADNTKTWPTRESLPCRILHVQPKGFPPPLLPTALPLCVCYHHLFGRPGVRLSNAFIYTAVNYWHSRLSTKMCLCPLL